VEREGDIGKRLSQATFAPLENWGPRVKVERLLKELIHTGDKHFLHHNGCSSLCSEPKTEG
jgi:hypothetical protein